MAHRNCSMSHRFIFFSSLKLSLHRFCSPPHCFYSLYHRFSFSFSHLAAAIWELLRPLANIGHPVYMQWIHALCGLPGNKRADVLAREASALPQHETRIDTGTVQKVVARSATATWQRSWPDGWFRSIMGNRLPGPVDLLHYFIFLVSHFFTLSFTVFLF